MPSGGERPRSQAARSFNRLTEILNGKCGVSPDTALRLSRYFGPSTEFRLGLQGQYDLARTEKRYGAKIRAEAELAA